MILIVAHHFAVHSEFNFSADALSPEKLYIQFIQMGGKIGVDIFVLISGYFMSKNYKFNPAKIFKFVGQCFFISVTMYIILLATGVIDFSFKGLIENVLPLTFNKWWFATCYFVLMIFSPFLNILIDNISKKSYTLLLCAMIILWCLFPTFIGKGFLMSNLTWFFCLYFIAGYIRKYADDIHIKKSISIISILVLTLLTYSSAIVFDIIGQKYSIVAENALHFFGEQQLPILLISFFTFMLFKDINIKPNKVINSIAATSFGVYLIHDNGIMHSFLWNTLAKNSEYSNTLLIIPHSIAVILIVYASCTILDMIRIKTIEPLYMKAVNALVPKIYLLIDKAEKNYNKKDEKC